MRSSCIAPIRPMGIHERTCLHYSRRNPQTGRTCKRFRWEQTARPVFNEQAGKWEMQVEPWREFKRPLLSNGDLVDAAHAVDPHL